MMNENEIVNIRNILGDAIAKGYVVIGMIISVPDDGIDILWRTADPTQAEMYKKRLFQSVKAGIQSIDFVYFTKLQ